MVDNDVDVPDNASVAQGLQVFAVYIKFLPVGWKVWLQEVFVDELCCVVAFVVLDMVHFTIRSSTELCKFVDNSSHSVSIEQDCGASYLASYTELQVASYTYCIDCRLTT